MAVNSASNSFSSKEIPSLAVFAANKFYESPLKATEAFREKHEDLCAQFAEAHLKTKSHLLSKLFSGDGFCIFTTGSDGRHEKIAPKQSPVELIIYAPNLELDNHLIEKVQDFVKLNNHFAPYVEIKNVGSSLCETKNKIIPTRGLHSQFLAGSEEKYEAYLISLIREIQNMPTQARRKFNDNFVKDSSNKLSKCLENQFVDSVDFSQNAIYFDGSNFKQRATKYCHLRAVQYKLDKVICDHLKELSEKDAFEFLKSMPSNIRDLIDYLYSKNLLPFSFDEKENLKKAYSLSLMYLHIAQNLQEASRTTIKIRLEDSQMMELKKTFEITSAILKKIK